MNHNFLSKSDLLCPRNEKMKQGQRMIVLFFDEHITICAQNDVILRLLDSGDPAE